MSLIGEGPEYQRTYFKGNLPVFCVHYLVVTPLFLVGQLCFFAGVRRNDCNKQVFLVVFWYEEMSRGLFHTLKDELRSN